MRIIDIVDETISDGTGLRMSLYLSGCRHGCVGCHNPQSWCPNNGEVLDDVMFADIVKKYKANPLLNGITLTGGDPLYNFDEFHDLVKRLKDILGCNIWVYTGYKYEEIAKEPFMQYIDVLVDGRFIQRLFHPELSFKGSSNQRIINIAQSLKKNKTIILME
ncbi:MAG: anaerobic ribonucleoside-triphosphate reductase activating protein [Alphaproteobacteria bacterium]